MSDDELFRDLVRRVRAGDEAAAAELVRLYEPEVRRAVRVRLTDPQLRRVLDSMDVCQSVLANFFQRVTSGEFTLDEPGHLLRLLIAMARNKVIDQARRQQAGRRDQRRLQAIDPALEGLLDPAPSPPQIVAARDLLAQVRSRLNDEERRLADLRAQGRDWDDIGRELNAHPDTLRKRLQRALERVSRRLGLEEDDDV